MRRIKGTRPSAALIVAVVALVAALAGGAVAGVAVTALNKQEKKQVKKIARKQAKKQIEKAPAAPPGPKGEDGEEGPPGPSTGPAGGDLTGEYPNPTLADEAVTAAKVAPNSLGGDQINELQLVGFDRSAAAGSFSGPPGTAGGVGLGGGLLLTQRCTGSQGNVGIEIEIKNDSGFSRTVYANAITDGGTPQVTRTAIANGDTETIIDIADSPTDDLHHWVTVLIPQSTYQTHQLVVRTRSFGQNVCSVERFRTVTTG
jgi:hypothetical protein